MADEPKLTDAEWVVMRAVWQHAPANARDVLERVGGDTGWAYTTVKTLLQRLVDKGALRVRMRANTSLYEPVLAAGKARRSALRSLLRAAFDGSFGGLFQHLVAEETLTADERAQLAALLRDAEAKAKSGAAEAAATRRKGP